jgi:hypothetical protein
MQGIFGSDVGHRVRNFLPDDGLKGAERPTCSPCQVMFSEQPLDPSADVPYDTQRCDAKCVGKWAVVLRRLAMYTLSQFDGTFDQIARVLHSAGLTVNATLRGDIEVLLVLESDGQSYRFEMQSDGDGEFSWKGALAQIANKDGRLSIYVVLGRRGTTTVGTELSATALRALQSRLPVVRLDDYNIELEPRARILPGNTLHVTFVAKGRPARIFSKHRELRGDARPQQSWVSYIDPQTKKEWQYLSGPGGRRYARWAGGQSAEV